MSCQSYLGQLGNLDIDNIELNEGGDMVEICAVEFFKTTPAFGEHPGCAVRRCHASAHEVR